MVWPLISLICISTALDCEIKIGHLAQNSASAVLTLEGLELGITDFNNGTIDDYSNLFPNLISNNCTLSMLYFQTNSTTKLTIQKGLEMSSNFEYYNLTVPILLGMQFSSLSMLLSPMVEAFDLIHLSGSASSTFLTDYENFYRTIPDDDIQSLSLIKLCAHFNWGNVGVVHMQSSYGTSLGNSLVKWGIEYNVSVQAFGYSEGDQITISDTVESMKSSGLRIFVLVVYASDWDILERALVDEGMIGFPYYYLGVDALFYESIFHSYANINKSFSGMIGSCPWSADSFTYSYPINVSIWKNQQLESRNIKNTSFSPYAYDNILVMLAATEQYINLYGYHYNDINAHIDSIGMAEFTNRYENILQHNISIISISGRVGFSANGDREYGLISYCNYGNNIISKIGYFFGEYLTILEDNIIWPQSFIDQDVIPPLDYYPQAPTTDHTALQVTLFGLGGIIMLLILIWTVFKLVKFCKKFITNFNKSRRSGDYEDDEIGRLLHSEKKRLCIEIFSTVCEVILSVFDYGTDIMAMIEVVTSKNGYYSDGYMITYFTFGVFATFVEVAALTISIKNVTKSLHQIKTGKIDGMDILMGNKETAAERESVDIDAQFEEAMSPGKRQKSTVLTSTHNQLKFKLDSLKKVIRGQAILIFVCCCEDIPFLVLNLYALLTAQLNVIILVALVFTAISLGFKLAGFTQFFGNLTELGFLQESCDNLKAHKKDFIKQFTVSASRAQKDMKGLLEEESDDDDNSNKFQHVEIEA